MVTIRGDGLSLILGDSVMKAERNAQSTEYYKVLQLNLEALVCDHAPDKWTWSHCSILHLFFRLCEVQSCYVRCIQCRN